MILTSDEMREAWQDFLSYRMYTSSDVLIFYKNDEYWFVLAALEHGVWIDEMDELWGDDE